MSKRTFPIVVDTWTEYERGWGSRPDGLSMHLNTTDHKKFLAEFNKKHNNLPSVPDEYTTADNAPRVVDVPESLYQRLVDLKAEGKLGLFAASREDEKTILAGKDPYVENTKVFDVVMVNVEGQPRDPSGTGVSVEQAKRRARELEAIGIQAVIVDVADPTNPRRGKEFAIEKIPLTEWRAREGGDGRFDHLHPGQMVCTIYRPDGSVLLHTGFPPTERDPEGDVREGYARFEAGRVLAALNEQRHK